MGVLLLFALFVVGFALLIAILFGWSYTVGWLIVQITPFSQFESTLLAMVASGIVFYFLITIFRPPLPAFNEEDEKDEPDFDEEIPATRFYTEDKDKTWEAWFRFAVANTVYGEFQYADLEDEQMTDQQLREIAIRLAEVSATLIKSKQGRYKRLTVTPTALSQQMTRMKLKPYDEEILDVAATGVNLTLTLPTVDLIIRTRLWDKPTSLFDLHVYD